MSSLRVFSVLCAVVALSSAAEPPIPPVPDHPQEPPFPPQVPGVGVQMLLPGFTVRELPVKLTSLNNIEYAADGRLFAGGYDGRFHLLRDTDGDGLEDRVDTFSPEASANYPLGVVVNDGDVYFVLADEIVRFRDTNGDGIPDQRETVFKGFDDPALITDKVLNHRRVDSSMALAIGPDGSFYTTMGNAGYNNAYWHDKEGRAHYSPERRRGCLLRFTPDGKVEQLASGLRYVMSLQWNAEGDLFGTDQEGATWVPNGNPFDELLHIQAGRHYGFPPRHPVWLPSVVDEPSTWDYGPQHESTCGFRFNGPSAGRGRFGPESWAGDAIVTGESRGKLWRTKLVKTAAGYVASTELIARLSMMPVDVAISPAGDLLVCCHSGKPDWGNGPKGEGHLFKVSYTGTTQPQPLLAWAASPTETVVEYDRALPAGDVQKVAIESGRYVDAADRLEAFRPGYSVVQMQQRQPREKVAVTAVRAEGSALRIETSPRVNAVQYALAIANGKATQDLAHGLTGVTVTWKGKDKAWTGWVPHLDLTVGRALTKGSALHEALWSGISTAGTLTLYGQLDLWEMLIPATQPGAKLDYTPEPETVTVSFRSDAALTIEAPGAKVERVSERESRLIVSGPQANAWQAITLQVATPVKTLDVAFTTDRDAKPRPLALRRTFVPFAQPHKDVAYRREIPEIAGGDWDRGHELFRGKAACATCHTLRGEGVVVGPDLNNLVHRDFASVVRDIAEPSAVINPDAIGYTVTMKDGTMYVGTRAAESPDELKLAQPGGAAAKLEKKNIAKTEVMSQSLMPPGLWQVLSAQEQKDLMTYLLTEPAVPAER